MYYYGDTGDNFKYNIPCKTIFIHAFKFICNCVKQNKPTTIIPAAHTESLSIANSIGTFMIPSKRMKSIIKKKNNLLLNYKYN